MSQSTVTPDRGNTALNNGRIRSRCKVSRRINGSKKTAMARTGLFCPIINSRIIRSPQRSNISLTTFMFSSRLDESARSSDTRFTLPPKLGLEYFIPFPKYSPRNLNIFSLYFKVIASLLFLPVKNLTAGQMGELGMVNVKVSPAIFIHSPVSDAVMVLPPLTPAEMCVKFYAVVSLTK